MSYANKQNTTTIQVKENLNTTGHQFKAIALDDGKVANNGLEAGGILLNKPKNNEFATLVVSGEAKFKAGAGLSIGARLTIATSGWFTASVSGDYYMGRAKEAVTSGSTGVGFFNFSAPAYQVSSM